MGANACARTCLLLTTKLRCGPTDRVGYLLQLLHECLLEHFLYLFVMFFLTGRSGVHYVVQIILKLLDSKLSEYSATFVGRLVSILISKSGSQLGEQLDLMLRAVLSKLQQAETLSVVQVRSLHS